MGKEGRKKGPKEEGQDSRALLRDYHYQTSIPNPTRHQTPPHSSHCQLATGNRQPATGTE